MTTLEGIAPTIRLYSGKDFNFQEPTPDMVTIGDIAHALSLVCRFAGQCSEFYSVAQHSMIVSQLTPGGAPQRLWGLLHDASEAYLGDVSRPLKRRMEDYQRIEERVQHAIALRFGLVWPMPSDVKIADNQALALEGQRFMGGTRGQWGISARWPNPKGKSMVQTAMDPVTAERAFLKTFHELGGR